MPIQVIARWSNCPARAQLALIVDGAPFETQQITDSGSHAWELRGGQDHWCLVTLRDEHGEMLALTNPIFFDGRGSPVTRAATPSQYNVLVRALFFFFLGWWKSGIWLAPLMTTLKRY